MTLNLDLPENTVLKPQITVFGVGGAGGNATNNMIRENLEGVNFVVANTDAQALAHSICEKKIQLGQTTTKGLGAGASPEVGKKAAEEAEQEIKKHLEGSNMVFITAGMGGGTGTGAAPVIARIAKENDILTVGVVTKPFHFEGPRRMNLAEEGLKEMQKHVDTLIVIPNQNLFRIANEKTTFADAFKLADNVLHAGVRGVTDLMIMPGLINLDFADVKAVMSEMGKAMMGTGEAQGERRAIEAAEAAISNPLLDNVSMKGAKGVLINITGGPDMTLFEVDEAANRIREEVDPDANIIFGSTFSEAVEGKIRVSVVATGIDSNAAIFKKIKEEQENSRRPTSAQSPFLAANEVAFEEAEEEYEEELEEEFSDAEDEIDEEIVSEDEEELVDDYEEVDEEVENIARRIFGGDINSAEEEEEEEETFVAPAPVEVNEHEKSSAKEQKGLLGRFAKGVARSMQSNDDELEEAAKPSAKPAAKAAKNAAQEEDEDDLVDVPAFLRRK